jgi:hypothetical protein
MKKFHWITLVLFLITGTARAQHVYQIRADSVRIYNVCDTAELIIENRTRGVSGFLFNKGNGRTEFRRIKLESIGNSQLAITGQDTLDLGTLSGIGGIDTIYRYGDYIRYVKKGAVHDLYAPANPVTNETLQSVTDRGASTTHNMEVRKVTSTTENALNTQLYANGNFEARSNIAPSYGFHIPGQDGLALYYPSPGGNLRIRNTSGIDALLWSSANHGAGSGLDADKLDGLEASVAPANSTVVARDQNGYIYSNYFNTTAATESATPTRIFGSYDNYIRPLDAASVRGFLGMPASGETLQSVTDRGNTTTREITAANMNWSGINSGNPRGLRIGYSGGHYGGIGYGIDFNAGSTYENYSTITSGDNPSLLRFSQGFEFLTAPTGTGGSAIAWNSLAKLDATHANFFVPLKSNGHGVWHAGNFNPDAKANTSGAYPGLSVGDAGALGGRGASEYALNINLQTPGASAVHWDNITSKPFIGDGLGNWGQQTAHAGTQDFNGINRFGSTYINGQSGPPANSPANGSLVQYYSWAFSLGAEYPVSSYNLQFAMGRPGGGGAEEGPYLYKRFNENSSYSAWQKIWAGNADQVGGISADRIVWGEAGSANNAFSNNNLNTLQKSGFYNGTAMTGAPSGDWYNVIHSEHSNLQSNYGNQLAQQFTGANKGVRLFARTKEAGVWGTWETLWHSGNFNPDAKANTSGSYPGITAGGADNASALGGIGASGFIQNQYNTHQTGDWWVSGAGRAGASGLGHIRMLGGNDIKTGYLEFVRPNNVRNGYIGYDETDIFYMKESGGSHRFKGGTLISDNRIYSGDGFRHNGYLGMVGDYDVAGYTPKIIWTIGESWVGLQQNGNGFYGLGYRYENNMGAGPYHQIVVAEAGTVHTRINMGGGIWTNGQMSATGFYQSSLASLKDNISDFTEPAMPLINGLIIKEFTYKADKEHNIHFGIIADSSDWHFSTKNHDKFDTNSSLAITIKAMQELSKKNEALEEKVKSLEERLAKLEKLLE